MKKRLFCGAAARTGGEGKVGSVIQFLNLSYFPTCEGSLEACTRRGLCRAIRCATTSLRVCLRVGLRVDVRVIPSMPQSCLRVCRRCRQTTSTCNLRSRIKSGFSPPVRAAPRRKRPHSLRGANRRGRTSIRGRPGFPLRLASGLDSGLASMLKPGLPARNTCRQQVHTPSIWNLGSYT